MEDDAHFARLVRMYAGAPINTTVPSRLEVERGRAVVTIDVSDALFHAAGSLHGSIYFKALDDAAFFAANSVEREGFTVTARFEVELLAPVVAGPLRAVGTLDRSEGRKHWASSELFDGTGRLAGRGRGLFVCMGTLAEVPGYRDPDSAG